MGNDNWDRAYQQNVAALKSIGDEQTRIENTVKAMFRKYIRDYKEYRRQDPKNHDLKFEDWLEFQLHEPEVSFDP